MRHFPETIDKLEVKRVIFVDNMDWWVDFSIKGYELE